jgi:hypothetical protein
MPEKRKTNELVKWSLVHDDVVTIEEFLEWLESKGIQLAQHYKNDDGEDTEHLYPTYRNRRQLLEEYYEIDTAELERERRALLDEARKQ